MHMAKNIRLEIRKNRGRMNWMIFVILIMIELFYIAHGLKKEANLQQGWLMMFCNLPLLNSLFLPILLAILASRFMDIEHQGNMFKTLYMTMKPRDFFLTKLVYGFLFVLMICVLQVSLFLITGTYYGCPDRPAADLFALYFITTLCGCFIIYYTQLILSYFFRTQALSICIGLAGSFAGLFSLYLPRGFFQRCIPWGLFGSGAFVNMDWNAETRVTRYYLTEPDVTVFISYLLWLALLTVITCILLRYGDVEDGPALFRRHAHRLSAVRFHRLPVEMLKLKGSPAWIAFFILPLLSACIGTVNYTGNLGILKKGWYDLWTQHTIFLCYFFMPVAIGIFCGCIWRNEHSGTNMNQLLVNVVPSKIILEKYAVSVFISWLSLLWIALLYLLSGYFVGLREAIPKELADWLLFGYLGAACICAVQLFLSLILRNFVLPVCLSFLGSLAGLWLLTRGTPYLLPYSLFDVGMRANNPQMELHYSPFLLGSAVNICLFLFLSIVYLRKMDVRTHE